VKMPKENLIFGWVRPPRRAFGAPSGLRAPKGWSEQRLAGLVTRDSMIGTGFPKNAGRAVMTGVHGHGGMDGFG